MAEQTITPPPELRQLWAQQAQRMSPRDPVEWMQHVSEKAAQWSAAQELEACCEWMQDQELRNLAKQLRAARRPQPPSLKEQALALLDDCTDPEGDYLDDNALSIIRRALEELPDN